MALNVVRKKNGLFQQQNHVIFICRHLGIALHTYLHRKMIFQFAQNEITRQVYGWTS